MQISAPHLLTNYTIGCLPCRELMSCTLFPHHCLTTLPISSSSSSGSRLPLSCCCAEPRWLAAGICPSTAASLVRLSG